MSHDAELVAKVAEAIWTTSRRDEGTISATGANIVARAVLDALDLPGLIRAAKAEALTEAADSLSMLPPRIGAYVPTMADAIDGLRHRAAWYDPEEES